MTWPTGQKEWAKGRTMEYLRPYWDGHMFIAVYLTSKGYTLRKVGQVIGYSPERVRQMVGKAERIVKYHPRYRSDEIITCAESSLYEIKRLVVELRSFH